LSNTQKSSSKTFPNQWATENNDQIVFWSDFLEFFESIVANAFWNTKKTEKNIQTNLETLNDYIKINIQSKNFISSPPEINPNSIGDMIDELSKLTDQLQNILTNTISCIQSGKSKIKHFVEDNGHNHAEKNPLTPNDQFKDLLTETFRENVNLLESTESIENAAVSLSVKLKKLSESNILPRILESFSRNKFDDLALEEIRKCAELSDCLSMYDKHWIKEEIAQISDGFGSSMSMLVRNLQDFDLLRQIFEHLIAINLIAAKPGNLSTEWRTIEKNLLAKITKNLLTECEKLSFEFCFSKSVFSLDQDKDAKASQIMLW